MKRELQPESKALLITDSHVHFWSRSRFQYSWLQDVPSLDRDFLPIDFQKEFGTADVDKILVIQCCKPEDGIQEANWLTELAKAESRIAGIIAGAPLECGKEAAPFLKSLSGNPLIKGIRRNIQFESDPDFCLREKFIEGLKLLPEHGLVFDICVWHSQLPKVVEMVARCPEVTFVLEHAGKPEIKRQLFAPWKTQIDRLAGFPNVWCKCSSLAMNAPSPWRASDLQPYMRTILDAFGPDRICFGSDWPVSLLCGRYCNHVESVQELLNATERPKIFRENAIRLYRL